MSWPEGSVNLARTVGLLGGSHQQGEVTQHFIGSGIFPGLPDPCLSIYHPKRASWGPSKPIDEAARLEMLFQEILQNDERLLELCNQLPKAILHEHSGCHYEKTLHHAKTTQLFWDTVSRTFFPEGGVGRLSACDLELPCNADARLEFVNACIQPPRLNSLTSYKHFHATFVTTGSAQVPLFKRLKFEYREALRSGVKHVLLMVDFPAKFFREEMTLAPEPDLLASLCAMLDDARDALEREVVETLEHLNEEGVKAQQELGLQESIYGTDNPVNIGIQVEVAKTYQLSEDNPAPERLLAKFACDVALAIRMCQSSSYVRSINFVGPEYLTTDLEDQRVKIINALVDYLQYTGPLAYHAGELDDTLVSHETMDAIACRVVGIKGIRRLGHGYSLSRPEDLGLLRENRIVVELCPSTAELLLGITLTETVRNLIKYGIPFVVSTDDREVFQTTISKEIFKFVKACSNVSYGFLKDVLRGSLVYSDLDADGKDGVLLPDEGFRFVVNPDYKELIAFRGDIELLSTFKTLPPLQKLQVRMERDFLELERSNFNRI